MIIFNDNHLDKIIDNRFDWTVWIDYNIIICLCSHCNLYRYCKFSFGRWFLL